MTLAGLRVIVGLTYEVRGREQLPAEAGAHREQAPVGLGDPGLPCAGPELAVGLKEELTRIPVFGWYLLRAGSIRIDRGAAAAGDPLPGRRRQARGRAQACPC